MRKRKSNAGYPICTNQLEQNTNSPTIRLQMVDFQSPPELGQRNQMNIML